MTPHSLRGYLLMRYGLHREYRHGSGVYSQFKGDPGEVTQAEFDALEDELESA